GEWTQPACCTARIPYPRKRAPKYSGACGAKFALPLFGLAAQGDRPGHRLGSLQLHLFFAADLAAQVSFLFTACGSAALRVLHERAVAVCGHHGFCRGRMAGGLPHPAGLERHARAPNGTGYIVTATHSFAAAFAIATLVLLLGIASYVFLLGRMERIPEPPVAS